jgi:GNAT superfamily N-acetyltransferase
MPSIVSLSSLSRSEFDRHKKSFSCSNKDLEKYITQFAYGHQKEGLFQTYLYHDDNEDFLGFISFTSATIEREVADGNINIPNSIMYSIPAIKITRLCAFDNYSGQGIGTTLMQFAHILAVAQQKKIGCRAIIVDSKHGAIDFYKQFDFVEINKEEDSDTVFMIYDLLRPNELIDIIPAMIEFCNRYQQHDLSGILQS